MSSLVFATDGVFADEARSRHSAFSASNFYHGSMEPLRPDRSLKLKIEHHPLAPWAASRVACDGGLYERSWKHIRSGTADFFIIRFLKKGSATIWHNGRKTCLGSRSLVITGSMTPLRIELVPPRQGECHEEVLIAVPGTRIRERVDVERVLNIALDLNQPGSAALAHLIDYAVDYADALTLCSVEHIFLSIIDEIAHRLERETSHYQRPNVVTVRQRRIEGIMRQKFSDPTLSLGDVAQSAKVSRRYVSLLLSQNSTSFYKLLNAIRVEESARLLVSPSAQDMTIGQISLAVGFKSTAHFSAVFRHAFSMTPTAYRAASAVALVQ